MSLPAAKNADPDRVLAAEDAYDQAAPLYDDWKWQPFWRRAELPFVEAALAEFAPRRPRLLDVGCGTGWYLQQLAPLCAQTAGVDVSEGMLAVARRRAAHSDLRHADAEHLPFAPGAFDTVLSTRMLSHIARTDQVLDEITCVLAVGGVAILSDVDADHDYVHTRLPVAQGHVLAQTFKHARPGVQAALEAAGLRHRRSLLILEDGQLATVEQLGEPIDQPAAGWITAWSRD